MGIDIDVIAASAFTRLRQSGDVPAFIEQVVKESFICDAHGVSGPYLEAVKRLAEGEFTTKPQRRVVNGLVVSSNLAVYTVTEQDFIDVAGEEHGVSLTEEQLTEAVGHIDKAMDMSSEWREAVETALEAAIGPLPDPDEEAADDD